MKLNKIVVAVMLISISFSCSSTKIIDSWRAETAVTKPYHNMMIWGIIPEKDSLLRKQIENHLVNDLVGKGYHAVSSYEIYKAKAYKKLTAQEILDEFKATGVDAVITLVLLDKRQEDKYYPGGFYSQAVNNSGNLDTYYSAMYERVFTPGYYISSTSYYWEANLFEVVDNKRVYAVRTRSFDPASTETLAHENGVRIMKDMLKQKIILDHIPPTH